MVTPEEVAGVALFAALGSEQHEKLSRAAADITLGPGEFAAHEGADRGLFAVLEGQIEAVKTVDGVSRVVGRRDPGDIFGEVPITLGTVFPVGFRAAQRTRIMRLEPRDYHGVAAVHPDVAREVGRLAAHRMSGLRGLQGIAGEPPPPRALVVGHRWDASCATLRRFLDRNQITYRWLTPDAPDAEEHWGGPLPGDADLPTIRVVNGRTVVRPQLRRVAELRGLATEPVAIDYDAVIVGAGPAGLAAAVYGRPRACAPSSLSARRRAARPAPPGSRTTSGSRRACRGTSWRAGRCSRPGAWGRRSS